MICAEEAFICKDFAETNNMLKIITDFSASVKKVRDRRVHSLFPYGVTVVLEVVVLSFHDVTPPSHRLQPHALLQRVKSCISDEEEEKLMQITSLHSLNAFLLPIKTVGVQVTLTAATLHPHPPTGHRWYCSTAPPLPAYVTQSGQNAVAAGCSVDLDRWRLNSSNHSDNQGVSVTTSWYQQW